MNDITDYIKWRGDLPFSVSPVNEVDIALFAEFIVPDFEGIISKTPENPVLLSEAVKAYFAKHENAGSELGVLEPMKVVPMIYDMGQSERFRGVYVSCYLIKVRQNRTEQFGGLTFTLPDGTKCIVFKPTDDTLVGWKEDCMLAVSDNVAAQKDALRYLIKNAGLEGDIYLAGQSKGGNLAAYAAIHAPETIQKRIRAAYNIDGPGFLPEPEKIPGYETVRDRIFTLRSQNSTIGTLMHEPGTIITVHSSASGAYAHDPFTWEAERTAFRREPKGQSVQSRKFEAAMAKTLDGMSEAGRIVFINELFDFLSSGGAKTLTDIKNRSIEGNLEALKKLREGTALHEFLSSVMEAYMLPVKRKK